MRWLPYVIDQDIVRRLNARFSKSWEPASWPGEKPPERSEGPVDPRAISRLNAFAHRADDLMSKFRKLRG